MTTIVKPDIPGTSLRFIGETIPRILPGFAETVAVPIVADWGPVGSDASGADGKAGGAQLVTSFAEYAALFGDSDTPGRTAVAGAFAGQGLDGTPGAGGVYVYRMGTGSAAPATHNFANTAGSPVANALVLTAKYKGVRGNRISAVIDADPQNPSTGHRLRIRFDGAVVETYTYAKTDIAAIAAAVNARSNYVTAAENATGTALATTAGTSLAAGDDGSTLTSTEWLDALDALEFRPFSIFSPYDLTDSGILASLKSWIDTQVDANRPVVAVVGGAAGETVDTAITRSGTLNDDHFVNLGGGTYHDDLLGKDLSTSQLAPRIAGILAARGEERSLTFAKIAGLHISGSTGVPTDGVKAAIKAGVTVLMRANSPDAELRIAQGVTTYTTSTDASKPLDVFSDPRLVRIMDIFLRNMKEWGDETVIGNVPVNADTRDAVRGEALRLIEDLKTRGLVLTKAGGATEDPFVVVDDPQDPALADAIPFTFGWQFARTANYVIGEGRVR